MSISSEVSGVPGAMVARMERDEEITKAASLSAASEGAESKWDVPTKRMVVLILLIVGLIVFWLSRPVIPMLVAGGIGAYLLSPIVDFCERLLIPRSISTIVLYLLVFVGIILLPIFLVPVLLQQLQVLSDFEVNTTALIFIRWISERLNSLPDTIELFGYIVPIGRSLTEIERNLQQYLVLPTLSELLGYIQQLIGTATTVVGSTALFGLSVVGGIVQVFITFFVTFFLSLYLTKDAPLIRAYIQDLFPRSYQSELVEVLRQIGHVWQSFFRGQLALCIIIGLVTGLSLQAVGMPGALILGIVAGAFEVIPSLGPTLAMIPAVIVALIQGSDVLAAYGITNLGFAIITVAIYFIIQQLENSIIVPRVIGSSVNLHPVVIICGVVIGFSIAGIWGAFFAAPVIATFRVLGSYVHAKLLDYPPFQGHRLPPVSPRRPFIYRRTVKGDALTAQPATAKITRPQPAVSLSLDDKPQASSQDALEAGTQELHRA